MRDEIENKIRVSLGLLPPEPVEVLAVDAVPEEVPVGPGK